MMASPQLRRSLPLMGDVPRVEPRTVRVSLTDRCDLACVYCRPSRSDGYLEKRLDESAGHRLPRVVVQTALEVAVTA